MVVAAYADKKKVNVNECVDGHPSVRTVNA